MASGLVWALMLPCFVHRRCGIVGWAAFGGSDMQRARGQGRRGILSSLIVGGQLGWLAPAERARAADPAMQDFYTLQGSKTQTYMRFNGEGNVQDVVKAN